MQVNTLFGYKQRDVWLNRVTSATKLVALLVLTTLGMMTFDPRFLFGLMVVAFVTLSTSKIRYREYKTLLKLAIIFAVLNIVVVFLFSPQEAVKIYHSKHVICGHGYFTLSQEQLFYELNLLLKYAFSLPLVIAVLFTTHPSEFASGLNRIGVPYKIAYAVAITLRYIPDIQTDYRTISLAQQARGYEISKKASPFKRLKGAIQIVMPLVFSSLNRIETISQAMELRRFGRGKKRTWYQYRRFGRYDFWLACGTLIIVAVGFGVILLNHGRWYNPFH